MSSFSTDDLVGRLMEEHEALIALIPVGEMGLRISIDATFCKTLLLSAASYFETRLSRTVIEAFSEGINNSDALIEFVRNKAVERRYHDWFDWNSSNANKFFRAFGNGFQSFMADRIQSNESRRESIEAFMEMSNLRNQLVHQNFAAFALDKTVDEVFDLYKNALAFVDTFPNDLKEYIRS